jgi:hypothetical protein
VQTGGVKRARRLQHRAQTAPSSGRESGCAQAAQAGQKRPESAWSTQSRQPLTAALQFPPGQDSAAASSMEMRLAVAQRRSSP